VYLRECKNRTSSSIICAPKEQIDDYVDDLFVDAMVITDEYDPLSLKLRTKERPVF
jgi:hypothetical protein